MAGQVTDAGTKAARTRRLIIETALGLFREKGYDATTMRAIAAAAGVSLGNAYYYFASKEHLVQAFYDGVHTDHAQAAAELLDREPDLTARVIGVAEVWVDIMEPYRAFAGQFFKNAADPRSALSPFSAESAPTREASIALWRRVIDESSATVDPMVQPLLPELAWLYFMGVVLFWVHDSSERAMATRVLIHRSAPLVVTAIGLANLPVMDWAVNEVTGLIGDVKQAMEPRSLSTGEGDPGRSDG